MNCECILTFEKRDQEFLEVEFTADEFPATVARAVEYFQTLAQRIAPDDWLVKVSMCMEESLFVALPAEAREWYEAANGKLWQEDLDGHAALS